MTSKENPNLFVRHYLRLARNPAVVESFCRLLRAPVRKLAWNKMIDLAFADSLELLPAAEQAMVREYALDCAADTLERTSYGISDELSHLVKRIEVPIADLNVPSRMWHGEDDPVTDINEIRRYLATAPNAEVIGLPGVRQMVDHTHWEQILKGFLELSQPQQNSPALVAPG